MADASVLTEPAEPSAETEVAIPFRSRIVGHALVDPSTLVVNPDNFRTHSHDQNQAVANSLTGLGWLRSIKVNQRTGRLIDGHLRVELALAAGEPTVPVTYLDLTEAEESQALASFDSLGALAVSDQAKRDELLAKARATRGTVDNRIINQTWNTQDGASSDMGDTPEDKADDYALASIRTLAFHFSVDDYRRVLTFFEALRRASPEPDPRNPRSNPDLLLTFLREQVGTLRGGT